jgi:hypothetical protein
MNTQVTVPEWAGACIRLLQGPVYRNGADDVTWNLLTVWLSNISGYFAQIGLSVIIDQSDGYAFLAQSDDDTVSPDNSDTQPQLPHLIRKYALTPEVSLLCVLLREALDHFDTSQNESSMLILKESEIKEMLSVFLKEKADQNRLYNKLDEYLGQLVKLSFIRELNNNAGQPGTTGTVSDREFEVRRIIRAKINAEFLAEFKRKLQELNGTTSENGGEKTDDQ